jgi:hypothetical protein
LVATAPDNATAAAVPSADKVSSSSSGGGGGGTSLQGLTVAPGDSLILSADGVQVNVGRIEVVAVSRNSITVASRKALQLERYTELQASSTGSTAVTWRLDQDEPASMAMHQRTAVLTVAGDCSSARVARLRELIIDLAPPRMLPTAADTSNDQQQQQVPSSMLGVGAAAAATTAAYGGAAAAVSAAAAAAAPSANAAARLALSAGAAYLSAHGSQLNLDQAAVLSRILALNEYCLVLGMPGGCDLADSLGGPAGCTAGGGISNLQREGGWGGAVV